MEKKKISGYLSIIDYDDPRIFGVFVSFESKSLLILNIYLPSTKSKSDELSVYLGRISSIIAECTEENVCVIGDYNSSPGSQRFFEIVSMCEDNNMKFSDVERLPADR